jgi:multidrug resistance efflux pump
VTVRAPIEGEVTAALTGLSGSGVIEKNESLLHIRNVRADRTRLDSLNDRLGGLRIERLANLARIASTQQAHDAMAEDVELFAEARIRQLEARAAALESDIAAAGARHEVAAAAADRADTLARSGSISAAELQRVTLERTVAEQTEASAEHQLDAVRVELEALRAGRFVGDGYNDRPSTAEHRDELRRKLDDLYTSLSATQAEIARLEQEVAAESERYRELSDVAVSLPVAGRVWEVLTAPGEQVRQGQDLLKILDCSGAVVTANVTESVYNRLSVGSPARFRPTDGGPDLGGTVANLTGLAAAPANLAILPSALAREAYRVTVQVPALAADATCAIGRTGRVIFDKAPAAAS